MIMNCRKGQENQSLRTTIIICHYISFSSFTVHDVCELTSIYPRLHFRRLFLKWCYAQKNALSKIVPCAILF